jgi:hypothetical protein
LGIQSHHRERVKGMSIFTDIRGLTKGSGKSETWYRKQWNKRIQGFQQSRPQVGGIYYFHYVAHEPERMEWYDRYPMAYCIAVDGSGWLGANLHYLAPGSRLGTVNQIKAAGNKDALFFPRSTIHRYRNTEIKSPVYNIPEDEWDSVQLPLEYFVDESPLAPSGGRKISAKKVWG